MNRIILIAGAILLALCSYAQEHNSNRLTFATGKYSISPFLFSYSKDASGQYVHKPISDGQFRQRAIGLTKEYATPNAIVEGGFTYSLRPKDLNGYDMPCSFGRGIHMRFSAGPSFADDAITWLFGAQYAFSMFRTRYEGDFRKIPEPYQGIASTGLSPDKGQVFVSYFGGDHFGINTGLMLNFGDVMHLRAIVYYDVVRYRGIPGNANYKELKYRGGRISPEFSLFLFGDEDTGAGIKLSYCINYSEIESFNGKTENPNFVAPISMRNNYFEISLCLPQLMGK